MTRNEIWRIETYLRALFRLDILRLVERPKEQDSVDVYIGNDPVGVIFKDEEDGETSYAFSMSILEGDMAGVSIETYLRKLFRLDTISLVSRPKQRDSVELHIGGEFIGVVFTDEEDGKTSYAFNMAILEMDLPDLPIGP